MVLVILQYLQLNLESRSVTNLSSLESERGNACDFYYHFYLLSKWHILGSIFLFPVSPSDCLHKTRENDYPHLQTRV